MSTTLGSLIDAAYGFYDRHDETAVSVAGVILAALAVRYLSTKALRTLFATIAGRAAHPQEKRRIDTLCRVLRKAISLVVVAVAGMVVLNQVGISIAPILGAAGVVGIAVGFGAQSLVKDIFAGIVLLVENQIRVGDVVEIAGLAGVVEEMSLRKVRLRSYDGSVHHISNGLITTVTNRSTDYAYAVIDIGVDYRSDLDQVFSVMKEVSEALIADPEYSARLIGPLEIAGVDQWADSAVMVRARMKTQPLEQAGIRRAFLKRLKAAFDEQGISIPFPHRTVILQDARGSVPAGRQGG
jgi:moderate conductance mechanosensitive channel